MNDCELNRAYVIGDTITGDMTYTGVIAPLQVCVSCVLCGKSQEYPDCYCVPSVYICQECKDLWAELKAQKQR